MPPAPRLPVTTYRPTVVPGASARTTRRPPRGAIVDATALVAEKIVSSGDAAGTRRVTMSESPDRTASVGAKPGAPPLLLPPLSLARSAATRAWQRGQLARW